MESDSIKNRESDHETSADKPSDDAGISIIPPVFHVMNHEELTERIEKVLGDTQRVVDDTNRDVASLRRELAQLSRVVEGLANMIRTPSGVTPGTRLETIGTKVDRLHHQAFEAGGWSSVHL